MPFESRSNSQVVTFTPAAPAYTQVVITAGTSATGAYLIVPPLLTSVGSYPPQAGDVFRLWTTGGTLKEPTLFTVSSLEPDTALNAWQVFFSPLPAVLPVAGDQVIQLSQPTNPRWLGAIGHVTGLTYSFTCPGGPDALSCTLQVPPDVRTDAMNPGRVVQVFRGAGCVWDGILNEPQPTAAGWTITALGAGNFGTNFADIYTNWGNPDDHVNEAIARGLRWVNRGIGTPSSAYLAQQQGPGSETITDFLTLMCSGGALLWEVQKGQGSSLPSGPWQLRTFPYTTSSLGYPSGAPTRMLVSTTPVARTIAADINSLVLYYETNAGYSAQAPLPGAAPTYNEIIVQNVVSARQHGVFEYFLDLSSSGVLSEAQVLAIGQNILSKFVRANWAGPFTVGPGQYLNTGGVPVDLGCEHAGEVVQLICSDASLGGEVTPGPITFLVGEYEFDDDTDTATVTPYAGVSTSMDSLISALYPFTA